VPSDKACPTGCSGDSYIPRHVLWFRKQFTLPSSWNRASGRHGLGWTSFRLTTVWINGVKVAYHDCG
jgi:hypothetical protein